MPRYFKLDSRKVTYREYWNIAGSWKVIFPWIQKLLGQPMNFSMVLPAIDSIQELEMAESDFPPAARQKLQPLVERCLKLGFHSPRYYSYDSLRRDTRSSFISLLHESGTTMLRLSHSLAFQVHPPKESLSIVMVSPLQDGTRLVTTNRRPNFLNAPGTVVNRLVGAGPEPLFQAHDLRLALFKGSQAPQVIQSQEQMDEIYTDYEIKSREFGMQRGIYVWMTPDEIAAEQTLKTAVQTQAGATGANEAVLWQINQLQTKQSGWGNILLILVFSLFLFVVIGARQWSWSYVLMLIPILFIHELGHYLAMRAFNYRNLRMFFIPMFGAAVAGQHYNLAGWKKVIVYLMGPVPGIVLGAMLGGAGLLLHQALLTKFALLMLFLNGFNLLPILPFDGGWVFHILIFSRQPLVESIFRVVAALCLMVIGVLLHTVILGILGFFMLMAVPAANRMAKTVALLRTKDLPPVPDEAQSLPPATAQMIIEDVIANLNKSGPKQYSPKLVATQTLQIFETLNTRPPGWLASLALIGVHLGSLGVALVFACLLFVGQYRGLGNFLNDVSRMPKHRLAGWPIPVWRGNLAVESTNNQDVCVIATFPTAGKASACFQDLTNRLPATAVLKLFGDTLLLDLPPNRDDLRKTWVDDLEARTKEVFVESTNAPLAMSVAAMATNALAATNLAKQLNLYFYTMPDLSLIPPWFPYNRSPEEIAQQHLARSTFQKLQGAVAKSQSDDSLADLRARRAKAVREGDGATVRDVEQQIKEATTKAEAVGLAKIRQGDQGPVDLQMVDWFMAHPVDVDATTASNPVLPQMAERMGQLVLVNGHTKPSDERFCAHSGLATANGAIINIRWLSFSRIEDGAPELVQWLSAQGCTHLRYEILDQLTPDGGDVGN